jgi:hypothetical protein
MKKTTTALARPLAWSMAALSGALVAIDLAISLLAPAWGQRPGPLPPDLLTSVSSAAPPIAYALVGALVAARQPRNPIGWLFSTEGVLLGLTVLAGDYRRVAQPGDVTLPGAGLVQWLSLWIWRAPRRPHQPARTRALPARTVCSRRLASARSWSRSQVVDRRLPKSTAR